MPPWWTLLWILVGLSGSLGPVIYYAWIRHAAVSARDRPARLLIGRAKYIDGASLADLPESTVVRVKGQVRRLEHELRAPIRGQPCVYWRITAAVQRFSERRGRYGQRHTYWQDMIDHSEGVPFVLADGASECSVDPALGTVSVGKPLVVEISSGQVIPSSLAVMLAEQRVSLDELRTETWRFEQTIVAIDASVVVVGAGRRVERSSVQGERDYRAAQATWVVLDGSSLELLITDDKWLMRQEPGAVPTDLDPRERWQGRTVLTPEQSLVPIDEYEASLKSRRKLVWLAMLGAGAIGATVVFGVPAILRAMRSKDTPQILTDEQVKTLQDITQKHRVAAYRSDDAWRVAMEERHELVPGDAPCAALSTLAKDAMIPIAVIPWHGALPAQSPRTGAVIQQMDQLDGRFAAIAPEAYDEELALVSRPAVSPLDVVFEGRRPVILWLYDHGAGRIVCRGEPDHLAGTRANIGPGELGSLRAVPN